MSNEYEPYPANHYIDTHVDILKDPSTTSPLTENSLFQKLIECCCIDPSLITNEFLGQLEQIQCSKLNLRFAISSTIIYYYVLLIGEDQLLNTVRKPECQVTIPNIFPFRYFASVLTWMSVMFFFKQNFSTFQTLQAAEKTPINDIQLCLSEGELLNYILIIIVLLRRTKTLTIQEFLACNFPTTINTETENETEEDVDLGADIGTEIPPI